MLGTDTPVSLGHLFENLLIMPLHIVVLCHYVNVDISVANVSISKDELSFFS